MPRKILLLLSCIAIAQGYTTFSTTCTTPTTPVNFVTSAGSRGTLDILWSCLFTIFACTWTIQHLNVPEQRENCDPGWRGDIKWALKSFWTSTKCMLATAIAPELLLGKAWGDLVAAKVTLKELQVFAENDSVSWTLTHSLFANMGGFVIRWNLGEKGLKETHDMGTQTINDDLEQPRSQSGLDASSYNNNSSKPSRLKRNRRIYTNPSHVRTRDILRLRREELIKKLPDFTVEDINDKSKTDPFSRTIAIVQILWTAIQIIARASAIIIYGLNWKKPKGIQVPYTILQYADEIPEHVRKVITERGLDDLEFLPTFDQFLTDRQRQYGASI